MPKVNWIKTGKGVQFLFSSSFSKFQDQEFSPKVSTLQSFSGNEILSNVILITMFDL